MLWQPSKLTPAQQEERRLAAGRLLRAGRLSHSEIARRMGVSRMAVWYWAQQLREQPRGLRGLRRRLRPGRPPRLTPPQWQQVLHGLRRGARRAGFPTEPWTLQRVGQWIKRRWGVSYHPRYLGDKLHRLGWSCQHYAPQAAERDAAWVLAWLRQDWPRIKKSLAAQGGNRVH